MSKTIILDNGAHRIKAGYSGDAQPKLVLINFNIIF